MRPPKTILLAAADAYSLDVLSFLLQVRGFRVLPVREYGEACAILRDTQEAKGRLDLLMVREPFPEIADLLLVARELQPLTPTMVLLADAPGAASVVADALLPRACASPAEIVERAKILTVRKRGPLPKVAA